jgi:tetratricopeptide (TPR) repeat protein
MANDWFRKTSWSEADQADFYAHFKRSRGAGNKAQYLRIQAGHLENTGSPELLRAALTLLEKMISEFPEPGELACAYNQKASCLAALGQIDLAIASYRLALDTERNNPKRRTRAWLEFGRFVCDAKLTEHFGEAFAVLDELKLDAGLFPVDVYELSGIRAIVTAHRGDAAKAKQYAKTALKAAAETNSGFRYHPTVGLVRDKETPFYKSVQAIAQS